MNNHATNRNVLWADDDARNALESVARLLRKRGNLDLKIAEDYREAVEALRSAAAGSPNDRFTGMIVDTILPPGVREAALGSYMGIQLADLAVTEYHIDAIVFLSVVPYGEIADRFEELQTRHPAVSFAYFNKLLLFDGKHFDNLVESLPSRRT